MVSRDSTVHTAVVAAALVLIVGLNWAFPDADPPLVTLATLLLYGLVLAGAHLYLAWLGDDGDGLVPAPARWRFVGVVALLVAVAAVVALTEPVPIGGVSSHGILTGLAVAAVLGYWVLETRAGYRDATRDQTT